jgi:hypothetical protein
VYTGPGAFIGAGYRLESAGMKTRYTIDGSVAILDGASYTGFQEKNTKTFPKKLALIRFVI